MQPSPASIKRPAPTVEDEIDCEAGMCVSHRHSIVKLTSNTDNAPPPITSIPSAKSPSHQPGDPFIEHYPNTSAGAPLNNDKKHETDLDSYMHMCGSLADLDNFKVTELLMTTGLTDNSKDKHLKSKMVSCPNKAI